MGNRKLSIGQKVPNASPLSTLFSISQLKLSNSVVHCGLCKTNIGIFTITNRKRAEFDYRFENWEIMVTGI